MDEAEEVEEIEKGVKLMRSVFLRGWLRGEFERAMRQDKLSPPAREFYEEVLCGSGEPYLEWDDD